LLFHGVEMMTSYSKVFKAPHVSFFGEVKVLTHPIPSRSNDEGIVKDQNKMNIEAQQKAVQIIEEAQKNAQKILEDAHQKANLLESAAKEEISIWWVENKEKLEMLSFEANQKGYQDGLIKGKEVGRTEIQREYEGQMKQVQNLLCQAYDQKEAIISEAEPFLLELSGVIASQILKQELHSYPEKFIETIKQHILRVKEKESITVCVHPDDFEFVQEQRSYLLSLVNGETEIKIIPDHSVSLKGCIIRTSYGSIDARIDAQLEELKKVIFEVRRELRHDLVS
jgi:flagellar assembly protein FliH